MKKTVFMRYIDELGFVEIPEVIRNELKIKDEQLFEVFTTEDGVFFKKYNPEERKEKNR